MSLINTQVKPFKATAFHAGKFVEVTEQTLKRKWNVLVFYPGPRHVRSPDDNNATSSRWAIRQ
jgi:hypothetical protein